MSLRPITFAEIEAARTPKGGWTAKQLRLWGVGWPPKTGWRKRILRDGVPSGCPVPDRYTPLLPAHVDKPEPGLRDAEGSEAASVRREEMAGALEIYTDGSCDPNPGPGGWGFAVYRDGVEIHEDSGGDLTTTNNRMELSAIIEALSWLQPSQPAIIWTDSQYCQKGCTIWRHSWRAKGWKRGVEKKLANADLWRDLDALIESRRVEFRWTRGHVGTAGNERADELAEIGRRAALAGKPLDGIAEQLRAPA